MLDGVVDWVAMAEPAVDAGVEGAAENCPPPPNEPDPPRLEAYGLAVVELAAIVLEPALKLASPGPDDIDGEVRVKESPWAGTRLF